MHARRQTRSHTHTRTHAGKHAHTHTHTPTPTHTQTHRKFTTTVTEDRFQTLSANQRRNRLLLELHSRSSVIKQRCNKDGPLSVSALASSLILFPLFQSTADTDARVQRRTRHEKSEKSQVFTGQNKGRKQPRGDLQSLYIIVPDL